jgi:hypothetical protein
MSKNFNDISEFFREVPPFLKVFNITNAYPTDDEQFIVEFNPGGANTFKWYGCSGWICYRNA